MLLLASLYRALMRQPCLHLSSSGCTQTRVPLLSGLVMDLLHQRLQRAPTDLAQVAVVVRHDLLAVAGAVDADARPPQIVVRFAQAAIANERRFRSHRQASIPIGRKG